MSTWNWPLMYQVFQCSPLAKIGLDMCIISVDAMQHDMALKTSHKPSHSYCRHFLPAVVIHDCKNHWVMLQGSLIRGLNANHMTLNSG